MSQTTEDVPGDGRWGAAEWLLLLVLSAVQFTHILDFMILMPLGPRYLRELAITPQQFGVLVSAYAFSACLAGLVAATVIDRFDRKTALLFLAAGFTLGTLLCAVAPGYGTLLAGRCVAGFFGGILGALNLAIIGDAFPEWQRGLATGVIMSAFSVATIVGVPAGLFLAQAFGTWTPFAILAGLSSAMMVLAGFALPPLRKHLSHERNPLAASTLAVLLHPAHLRAYLLMVCLVLGMFTIVPYLATFLVVNVGLAEDHLWVMYLCGGLGTLSTMSLFGRLADHFGKLPVFRIMAVLTAVLVMVLTMLARTSLVLTITITTAFMVVSSGRMVPAMAMITSSARPAYRGSFMSIISSVQQAAAGLASLVAGVILTQPVQDGPLVGFPIVGLLACVTTLLCVWVAGYVRPAGDTPLVPDLTAAPVPAGGEETAFTTEAALTGVLPVPEAIQGTR